MREKERGFFEADYDNARTDTKRKQYGRWWLIFLVLRFTGARISEVLNIKYEDIDFRNAGTRLITLKRHNPRKKNSFRIVPVPVNVTSEIATYIAQYPQIKDTLFQLDRTFFYRVFKSRCEEAGIPKELAHPHILRHTRAIELLRAGVPVTIVQNLLGHSALTTTAVYLKISNSEAKQILRDRGLI
ncbi:tyrosine-type recombinase/integrase [Hippea alviniae]|uniref:tyrosine-type recombinase/integrase n=1 Tax=Hippea alviniae TaxID=1279027 RepID=UPI0003B407A7|nr:site-specific integrase [Hippea alviniae]